jgi:hypothetical protein
MYLINTSYQTKLLPFEATIVTQILKRLQGEEQTMFLPSQRPAI